jgi:hypothetical protein
MPVEIMMARSWSPISIVPIAAAAFSQAKLTRIGYTTGHGEVTAARLPSVGPDLANMVSNLTKAGYTVVEIKERITSEKLAGIDFLILGHVFGKNLVYTPEEITAVKEWFSQGKKTLWVTSDSDFGGGPQDPGDYIIEASNKVLEAVGSKLRFEYAAVDDPVSNAGAAYRVVGNVTNTKDPEVKNIVQGVQRALFHGPTAVVAVTPDGKWVDMRQTKVENVFWVIASSDKAVITNNGRAPLGIDPKVYTPGQTGSYVLVAIEKFAGEKKNGKIIASGESPYGSYEPIFKSAYITAKQLEGPTLVLGLIDWGSRVEELPPLIPIELVIGVIIVAIVVALVIYRIRSRPKAVTPAQPAT